MPTQRNVGLCAFFTIVGECVRSNRGLPFLEEWSHSCRGISQTLQDSQSLLRPPRGVRMTTRVRLDEDFKSDEMGKHWLYRISIQDPVSCERDPSLEETRSSRTPCGLG
eukprot:scaffold2248_cov261-Pinguiococcus_pyrenoidosus.AAC.4